MPVTNAHKARTLLCSKQNAEYVGNENSIFLTNFHEQIIYSDFEGCLEYQ